MNTQSRCQLEVCWSSTCVRPISLPGDPSYVATSHIRKIADGRDVRAQGIIHRRATTVGMLPDNVLLEVFGFCRKNHGYALRTVWKWQALVHVCRRWRQIVFASPRRLNLRILCTYGTPVRKNLGSWPAFPIVVDYHYSYSKSGIAPNDEDGVIAALEHPDRVSDFRLAVAGSRLEKIATLMQEPFPALTHLDISSNDGNVPVLPAKFLGGSAPCLQNIHLHGIPFPMLPTLLLSASGLITLTLFNIPPGGYISPEAIVVCLAALPRLETFVIEFQLAAPRPFRICPPPVTRTVLSALISFQFRGASEYLEALVSPIDGPQLNQILIFYLNQLVDFQAAQLSKFVDRSVGPELTPFRNAQIIFSTDKVSFTMYRHANHPPWDQRPAWITILCQRIDWQVSHIAQVLSHFSATLSTVVHLEFEVRLKSDRQLEGTEDVEWLHLLHQFPAVRTLRVDQELAGHVALALEDITGEMVAEVLPSLDLIRITDQPASSLEKFVAARRLFDLR